MSKYIQSFYQYPVTFSAIGKGVPSRDADGELRNIVEVSEDELSKLEKQEPLFRRLVAQKKYRVLNHLPESYKPAATQVNEAKAEAEAAKAELAALKAQIAAEKAGATEEESTTKSNNDDVVDLSSLTLKELEEKAAALGIGKRKSKKEYIAAIEAANN